MYNKWSEKETKYLIENYNTKTAKEISINLNKELRSIQKKASYLKLKKSERTDINFNFFENDSEDLYYILGFTMADGCISGDRLSYGVAIKDISILEYIKDKICPSAKIKIYWQIRKGKKSQIARLRIGSIKLCNILSNYFIIPNKTGKERLSNIPEKYKKDYLRGLFDGDGCISFAKKNKFQLVFQIVSSSKEFLMDIKNTLWNGEGSIHNKKKNCFGWFVYKQESIINLYHYMYNTQSYYLTRKKERFEKRICHKK